MSMSISCSSSTRPLSSLPRKLCQQGSFIYHSDKLFHYGWARFSLQADKIINTATFCSSRLLPATLLHDVDVEHETLNPQRFPFNHCFVMADGIWGGDTQGGQTARQTEIIIKWAGGIIESTHLVKWRLPS